jgi:hypothetical protein
VKVRMAGLLPFPLCILGLVLDSSWLVLSGVVLSALAQLLAIRGDRDAFFTPVRVHRRSGLLGLVVEDVPIHQVDEVLVDALPHFPEMGNLTVQCRTTRLRFERVPDAEAKARRILELARVARERGQGGSVERV